MPAALYNIALRSNFSHLEPSVCVSHSVIVQESIFTVRLSLSRTRLFFLFFVVCVSSCVLLLDLRGSHEEWSRRVLWTLLVAVLCVWFKKCVLLLFLSSCPQGWVCVCVCIHYRYILAVLLILLSRILRSLSFALTLPICHHVCSNMLFCSVYIYACSTQRISRFKYLCRKRQNTHNSTLTRRSISGAYSIHSYISVCL